MDPRTRGPDLLERENTSGFLSLTFEWDVEEIFTGGGYARSSLGKPVGVTVLISGKGKLLTEIRPPCTLTTWSQGLVTTWLLLSGRTLLILGKKYFS